MAPEGIEEIDAAYRRLSAAPEKLVGADRELAEYARRVRLSLEPQVHRSPRVLIERNPRLGDSWRNRYD